MDVFSMIKHSLVAEGTNPITKHYQLGKHVASAGPEMVWKIYEATRLKDNKEVSIFLFEKRMADKLHKPGRREKVAEILRKEVKQMSRLKHPKILRLMHPLEECNDSIAFATEPVLASLANLLGNYERMPATIPQELKEHTFLDIEHKYGILQITEAMSYLHASEHIVHGNLSPQSIMITKRGIWKLAGLGFSERPKDGKDCYHLSSWTSKSPKMAQPDLDYIAPEIQMDTAKIRSCLVDMFSMGMLICALYNHGKSLLQSGHNTATYAKRMEQMTELFGEVAHKMPFQLVEPVEKMINKDIRYRPTAQHFMMLKYFDDPVARCMQSIDAVDSKDLSQKCEFFTKLAQAIPSFPKKVLYNSVFPVLREQLDSPDMLVLILPSLLTMIEHSQDDDYKAIIQPEFKRVFSMSRPVQATIYLLEKLDVILAKASEEEIQSDVLPMIFTTLESNSIQGQEAAISVFSTIKKYLDDQTMRKLVLPKAKSLFVKSSNVRTRLNALACVDRLIDSLDKMMILDEVLPFLTDINCQDVDIIMSVIAIYKHMLSDKKFGLTHNLLATKVMPTLIPHSVSPGLNIEQFHILMEVLREMLEQIDRQRRSKMMSEAPEMNAHDMRRPSLQQMYYLASRAQTMKLPEEYLMMGGMGKRSSAGSVSSIGSACSAYSMGRYSPRRTSIDMRYNVFDPPKQEDPVSKQQYLLSVDEAYYSKYRPPSTPELQTRISNESLGPRAYRRHSSFQGLGMEEQAVLEKIVRERRASLAQPGLPPGTGPHILVSEPSVGDFGETLLYGTPRRSSTQSMGPMEPGRRDSRGRLLDLGPHHAQRRSSFQGLCESAVGRILIPRPAPDSNYNYYMQLFGGK